MSKVATQTRTKTSTKVSAKRKSQVSNITPEQRDLMILEAAYYLAEKRGFLGGNPQQDWLEAEAEINQRLADTGN